MQKHLARRFDGRKLHPIGVGFLNRTVPAAPLTPSLLDHFTDADATNLSAHTMDLGPGWTVTSGTFSVSSNRARATTDAHYAAESGHADVTLTATVNIVTGAGTKGGFFARVTDANNGWLLVFNASVLQIIEWNAASGVVRVSVGVSYSLNTDHALRAVLAGASITVSVDGGNVNTYASASFNQTATKHGLWAEAGTVSVDDFQAAS